MKAMMTVNEVRKLTGVSIRTLHYYDEIGLLTPDVTTEAGYRLYDDASLERLQEILLFRELEFPLKEIKEILDSPGFDRERALQQQIELLNLQKERTERLISFAKSLKEKECNSMSFDAFDRKKLEAYEAEAKKTWGKTEAYREYEEKSAGYFGETREKQAAEMMRIFAEFGKMKEMSPEAPEVQEEVRKLQAFITENYYSCKPEILAGLGRMYAAGGEMTENIDAAGGAGTADFAAKAIAAYCK